MKPIVIHDWPRTYITPVIRPGVPLPTVQRLVGHANIAMTIKYYNAVSEDDLRDTVAKLSAASAR